MNAMDTRENRTLQPDESSPSGKKNPDVKPGDYLRAVKTHLRTGKQKEAYIVLQQAGVLFPNDPLIISYLGCFQAVVDRKYRTGVDNCKKAIVLLKKLDALDREMLYPLFHLNLGRALVAAGKKKDAIETFTGGLKYDSGNTDLLKEMRSLGSRKKPLLPFLERSNPINKYLGMLLHADAGTARKPKGRSAPRA
jgi:hypothetical protein